VRWQLALPNFAITTQTAGDDVLTSDDWYTPAEVVSWAEKCLGGIDTDPAWSPRSHVRPGRGFTISEDGLSKPWDGAVFLNPPYSAPTPWIARASVRHEPTLCLIKLDPSTRMWSQHVWPRARAIVFFGRRLEFARPGALTGAPPWPSCALWYGPPPPLDALKQAPGGSAVVTPPW
jgi:hypothetical protein